MRRVIQATAQTAQSIYRQVLKTHENQLTILPEVVVQGLQVVLPKDIQKKKNSTHEDLKSNDWTDLNKLGFHYFPNAISQDQSKQIVDEVQLYLNLFGATVEGHHYIQRDSRPLSTNHSIVQSIVQSAKWLKEHDVFPRPGFNLYLPDSMSQSDEQKNDNKKPLIVAHQDPLFSAQEVGIVSLGSPVTIQFTHWVTGHSFSVVVESNSLYIMRGLVRYEYMHGSAHCQHHGRLSLVFPIKRGDDRIESIAGQVWGQSDQRKKVDEWLNQSLSKLRMISDYKPNPMNLLQYLRMVEYQVHLKNLSPEDYAILKPTLERLKQMCIQDFGYS